MKLIFFINRRKSYLHLIRVIGGNPNFPPEIQNFIIQLCLRESVTEFERAHFSAQVLFQSNTLAPAYNALLGFANLNLYHAHRGVMVEVLLLFEMLLALETVYFMMPLQVDNQTAPIYAYIANYLEELFQVNKEQVTFEAFHKTLAMISEIPVRYPPGSFYWI